VIGWRGRGRGQGCGRRLLLEQVGQHSHVLLRWIVAVGSHVTALTVQFFVVEEMVYAEKMGRRKLQRLCRSRCRCMGVPVMGIWGGHGWYGHMVEGLGVQV